MTDQRIIETASSVLLTANRTAVSASGASMLAWIANLDLVATISLFVCIGGFFISVSSFWVNLYYRRKDDKRAQELHKIELKKLKEKYHVQ